MKNNKNGYTLVELLVVIIILVVVGTIVASILTSVLRSSNKSANTEVVRSNGNYAISQMSKMITYAQRLEGISANAAFSENQTDCVGISSSTKYYYLKIKSFNTGVTTFGCTGSQIIATQSAAETTTNFLVDPSLDANCYFNCTQESAAAPAKVDIFLDLKAKSSAVFSESQAEIPFETSVVIRNSANR